MLAIFSVLIGGILLGYILRGKNLKFLPRLITTIIWILLFFLGLEIGSDPDVISNFSSLGITALTISVFSVIGSIIASWILWKFIKRKEDSTNER